MPLFLVQDDDRPLYILADNYNNAEALWKNIIFEENRESYNSTNDIDSPKGIQFIAPDNKIVIRGRLREKN